jgi:transposase InsO family protein
MAKCRWQRGRRRRPVHVEVPGAAWLGRHRPPELSRRAGVRLEMLDWHRAHGASVARTARRFGYSRPTVYRWLARYDPRRLETLEDRSSMPRRRRRPTWSEAEVAAVLRLRETFPRWGKDKLAVLLEAEDLFLSVSRVGRILAWLRDTRQLREPPRRVRARRRRGPRPYAVRKPWGFRAIAPGDLVELDTMDVRPVPGIVLKQFTARDVVSRWDTLELAPAATAAAATRMLDALAARMPFAVRTISVDGGSEFMAGFETACQDRGIVLHVLPPRSPKLHGSVERGNRTHAEEFHECTLAEPTLADLGAELRIWETVYNEIRPHQALGYLTPRQFVDEWQRRHPPFGDV